MNELNNFKKQIFEKLIVVRCSTNFAPDTELKDSLYCSQDPATGTSPVPVESIQHPFLLKISG
jgi:hypothetical protein